MSDVTEIIRRLISWIPATERELGLALAAGFIAATAIGGAIRRLRAVEKKLSGGNNRLRPVGTTGRPVRVTKVIDGDTIELEDDRRVRLIGVDCPEARPCEKLDRDAAWTGIPKEDILHEGTLATNRVRELVEGKRVVLEFDPTNEPDHLGSYDRTLAHVWAQEKNGASFLLSRVIVEEGHAIPTETENEHAGRLAEAREKALESGVGRVAVPGGAENRDPLLAQMDRQLEEQIWGESVRST